HLGVVVAAPTLIAQISSNRHRGAALTLWSTFFAVSFALLAWAGRPFAEGYGIQALFAAHGVLVGGIALWLGVALRSVSAVPRKALPDFGGLLRQHLVIYGSAARISAAAGWLFYTACFVAILTVLPPFLEPGQRAFVIGTMPLASIAVSMTLGVWLLRVMPAVGVVMLGFGLSALGAVWLWVAPGDPVACLALAGAMGLVQGASFAAVPQINDSAEHQAQANGVMSQAGNLGNTIGTPLMLGAIGMAGYAGLVTLSAILFLGGLIVHLVLARARRSA
ncbi:MAG: MFS transporter, partial [Rhodobacteraceae bacterium]|nr:MFS transporter [Paracoccaceae bacterium]